MENSDSGEETGGEEQQVVIGGDVYEVEKVVGMKKIGGVMKYLVRWKNYGPEDDSWEPKENLLTCWGSVEEYLEEQKLKNESAKKKKAVKRRSISSNSSVAQQSESFYEQLRQEEITATSAKKDEVQPKKKQKEASKTTENPDAAVKKKTSIDQAAKTTPDAAVVKEKVKKKSLETSKDQATKTTPNPDVTTMKEKVKKKTLDHAAKATPSPDAAVKKDEVKKKTSIDQAAKTSPNPDAPVKKDEVKKKTMETSKDLGVSTRPVHQIIDLDDPNPEDAPCAQDAPDDIDRTLEPRIQLRIAVERMNLKSVARVLGTIIGDPDAFQVTGGGGTLLMKAASRQDNTRGDNCAIITALHRFGARLDMQNYLCQTAMMMSSENGSACCFKTLMKFVPNLGVINRWKENALFIAVKRKIPQMVKILLAHGAEYGNANIDGKTVMDIIDDQLKENPEAAVVKQMQTLLNDVINKMETAFSPVMNECGARIIPKVPLFQLRYFLWVSDNKKIEFEFDAPPDLETANGAAFITFIGIGQYGDPVELYRGRNSQLIDKVYFNGRQLDDITTFKIKTAFSSHNNAIKTRGNRLTIMCKSKVVPMHMIMVRTYACEIAAPPGQATVTEMETPNE